MTDYRLVSLRFQRVTARDDRGTPLNWTNHVFGDVLEDLDEKEAERLLKAKAIAPLEDEEDDTEDVEALVIEPPLDVTPEDPDGVVPPATPTPSNPFDDPGTTEVVEEFKRPSNSAPVDKWRVFSIAKVKAQYAAEGIEVPEEILEEIDTAERPFLIKTYGPKDK